MRHTPDGTLCGSLHEDQSDEHANCRQYDETAHEPLQVTQLLINAVTGHVGTRSHLSGNLTIRPQLPTTGLLVREGDLTRNASSKRRSFDVKPTPAAVGNTP